MGIKTKCIADVTRGEQRIWHHLFSVEKINGPGKPEDHDTTGHRPVDGTFGLKGPKKMKRNLWIIVLLALLVSAVGCAPTSDPVNPGSAGSIPAAAPAVAGSIPRFAVSDGAGGLVEITGPLPVGTKSIWFQQVEYPLTTSPSGFQSIVVSWDQGRELHALLPGQGAPYAFESLYPSDEAAAFAARMQRASLAATNQVAGFEVYGSNAVVQNGRVLSMMDQGITLQAAMETGVVSVEEGMALYRTQGLSIAKAAAESSEGLIIRDLAPRNFNFSIINGQKVLAVSDLGIAELRGYAGALTGEQVDELINLWNEWATSSKAPRGVAQLSRADFPGAPAAESRVSWLRIYTEGGEDGVEMSRADKAWFEAERAKNPNSSIAPIATAAAAAEDLLTPKGLIELGPAETAETVATKLTEAGVRPTTRLVNRVLTKLQNINWTNVVANAKTGLVITLRVAEFAGYVILFYEGGVWLFGWDSTEALGGDYYDSTGGDKSLLEEMQRSFAPGLASYSHKWMPLGQVDSLSRRVQSIGEKGACIQRTLSVVPPGRPEITTPIFFCRGASSVPGGQPSLVIAAIIEDAVIELGRYIWNSETLLYEGPPETVAVYVFDCGLPGTTGKMTATFILDGQWVSETHTPSCTRTP